tara:strand:+ start:18634 stop:18864 length:231 start_codon:yes stop_codon:yes gene_type:complete
MAFGTVPIIPPRSIYESTNRKCSLYYSKQSRRIERKISVIAENKWGKMSKASSEWYAKNVHSTNCWNNMIDHILYV